MNETFSGSAKHFDKTGSDAHLEMACEPCGTLDWVCHVTGPHLLQLLVTENSVSQTWLTDLLIFQQNLKSRLFSEI